MPDEADAPLRVIVGATAAGKSAIALALAERFGASIISADSRQVYRDFDIGTAKPALAERERVPTYGVDIVAPTERFNAAAWCARVHAEWLPAIRSVNRTPLVVGGTGFYVRSLVEPLFDEPELDEERRRALTAVLDTFSLDTLERWCAVLDPPRARFGRAQFRRAIETALLAGQRISALHAARRRAPGVTARYLVVDAGVALAGRITRRVDDMLHRGWLDEVAALAGRVPDDAPAWNATGYAAMRAVVRGERTLDEARERVVIDTRQYAKRQRTWIRHQLPADRVTIVDATSHHAIDDAMAWWDRHG